MPHTISIWFILFLVVERLMKTLLKIRPGHFNKLNQIDTSSLHKYAHLPAQPLPLLNWYTDESLRQSHSISLLSNVFCRYYNIINNNNIIYDNNIFKRILFFSVMQRDN